MDSVDIVGETAADFFAAATFDGARHEFVFRMGEHGIGYYRDGGATRKVHSSQLSAAPVMPPPPPRPPPPRPPPAQPAAAQSASFWQQLEEVTEGLDGDGGSSTSLTLPEPIPANKPPRAPSPPARVPSPGATEIIVWRPHRRRHQQRTVPYMWPTAPRATRVAQQAQAQAQAQVQAQAQAPSPVQRPPTSEIQVDAMLTEWTEGAVPGSREWIQALRNRGAPQPQWWSTGLHFE